MGVCGCFSVAIVETANAQVDLEWVKQLGGNGADQGNAVKVDNWGNVYTTGYFRDTVDFDPGNGVYNLISSGLDEIYISKLDAAGNFKWAKRLGSNDASADGGDQGKCIAVDEVGNIYTTGYFSGLANFNSGIGSLITAQSNGLRDIFITKHDSTGALQWVKTIGGSGNDIANSIVVSGNPPTIKNS